MKPAGDYCGHFDENIHYTQQRMLAMFGECSQMNRFDFQPLEYGDFSARIHAIGCLYVTLIYRLGDDEFPAEAELFFNAPVKRVFCADDASVLAGRICFGLF